MVPRKFSTFGNDVIIQVSLSVGVDFSTKEKRAGVENVSARID